MARFTIARPKDNRQVDEGDGVPKPAYQRVDSLAWSATDIATGKNVHVKDFPRGHRLQLFRLAVSFNRTDYVVTNDLTQDSNERDTRGVCRPVEDPRNCTAKPNK